jgi:L1 cell adhesion molecule like protein
MVNEAERFKAEDEQQREKIDARNRLESYVFSVKQILSESGDKLPAGDRETVTKKCEEMVRWLDANTLADKEEYEHKMKEFQSVCAPVMTKMHQQAGAGCGSGAGQFGGMSGGPTVEEVH